MHFATSSLDRLCVQSNISSKVENKITNSQPNFPVHNRLFRIVIQTIDFILVLNNYLILT